MRTKLSESDKKFLLNLARGTIKSAFPGNYKPQIDQTLVPIATQGLAATFVTLTQKGELRGCIGKLTAVQPMYQDVAENAYSAAFEDTRFSPLTKQELDKTKIEISILTQPTLLEYKDTKDLLHLLENKRPGVVIEKGYYTATFLPQVWEELANPSEFLSYLCAKAGLDPNEWESGNLIVKTYTVTKFEEI
ncbi:AmmeMemoRadiSam system protein A [Candidatus Dojkabacteria bacterium]|nr:AmmeMemoRadiSam system protein A [Candidatus Dojkabacteria bacterium]